MPCHQEESCQQRRRRWARVWACAAVMAVAMALREVTYVLRAAEGDKCCCRVGMMIDQVLVDLSHMESSIEKDKEIKSSRQFTRV